MAEKYKYSSKWHHKKRLKVEIMAWMEMKDMVYQSYET